MAKLLAKERIIFSNYDLDEQYTDEFVREELAENGNDDPTESQIWDFRNEMSNLDWDVAKDELESFFNGIPHLMAFGEVGRWNGVYKAGRVFDTLNELLEGLEDCYYWKFYDENGHLFMCGSHHDGSVCFEIKEISDKGIEYLNNWEYGPASDKRNEYYVHTQIFKRYSKLPHFAHKVYGNPVREYC